MTIYIKVIVCLCCIWYLKLTFMISLFSSNFVNKKIILLHTCITGKRIGIALHYCEPIGAERSCGDDEVAMVMEGGSIPEKISSVNCKCSGGEPLKIQKSYFRGWKWNHDLVCSMVGIFYCFLLFSIS